ncbi:MAG: hypothetical protein EXX96DRAFT_451866, partial [Benjaminiella poitrasii]
MDWEEEVGPYHLQTLTRLRLHRKKQSLEQKSTDEGLDDEMEEIARKTKQQSNSYN